MAALPGDSQRASPPSWLILLLVPMAAMVVLDTREGRALLDRLTAHGEAITALPGLTLDTAPHAAAGLVVTSVRSDSQAARGGIVVGDAVVAIDRTPMVTLDQVRRYLQRDKAGSVDLRVMHGDRPRDIRLGREGG